LIEFEKKSIELEEGELKSWRSERKRVKLE